MYTFETNPSDSTREILKPLLILGAPVDYLPFVEEILKKFKTLGYTKTLETDEKLERQVNSQREQFSMAAQEENSPLVAIVCHLNDWHPFTFTGTWNDKEDLSGMIHIVSVEQFLSPDFKHEDKFSIMDYGTDALPIFGAILNVFKNGENVSNNCMPSITLAVLDVMTSSEKTVEAVIQTFLKVLGYSQEEINRTLPAFILYNKLVEKQLESSMENPLQALLNRLNP
jgi:hypothetical protein